MPHVMTAEKLFRDLKQMPASERLKFFAILSNNVFRAEDANHEELFGHLANDVFTAQEAAEYLEVSLTTFRRMVASGKLSARQVVGRNQMFAVPDLKAFKKALKTTRG